MERYTARRRDPDIGNLPVEMDARPERNLRLTGARRYGAHLIIFVRYVTP